MISAYYLLQLWWRKGLDRKGKSDSVKIHDTSEKGN